MPGRLIVNADDYGHTPGVSAGIRAAHLNGIVTSTTVMMNRPNVMDALKAALEECPHLGIGIHLVLTSGIPTLPPVKVGSLVEADGKFPGLRRFTERLGGLRLDEVRAEWQNQVDLFVSAAGRAPDHLDSHHHSAWYTPGLFEEMLKISGDLKCPIRNLLGDDPVFLSEMKQSMPEAGSAEEYKRLLARYSPACPQKFLGNFYDEGVSMQNLVSMLDEIARDPLHQTWELMCHPANVDDELLRTSIYNDKRELERLLLEDSCVIDFIRTGGIELINFSRL